MIHRMVESEQIYRHEKSVATEIASGRPLSSGLELPLLQVNNGYRVISLILRKHRVPRRLLSHVVTNGSRKHHDHSEKTPCRN